MTEKLSPRKKRISPRLPPKRQEKYLKIKNLKCFQEVHDRLVEGFSPTEVARYIQEDCGEYTELEKVSLVSILSDYRKNEISTAQLVAPVRPKAVVDAFNKFNDGTIELGRLDELYEIQKKRVNMGVELESRINMMNPRVGTEIEILSRLIGQMHDVKMDLGMSGGRKLGTVTVRPEVVEAARKKYGEKTAEALLRPESRGKVLSIINQIRSLSEKNRDSNDSS